MEFSVDSKYVCAIELKEVGKRKVVELEALGRPLLLICDSTVVLKQTKQKQKQKTPCFSTGRELDFTAGSGQIGMVGNDPE